MKGSAQDPDGTSDGLSDGPSCLFICKKGGEKVERQRELVRSTMQQKARLPILATVSLEEFFFSHPPLSGTVRARGPSSGE